jgi:hypothetical protein
LIIKGFSSRFETDGMGSVKGRRRSHTMSALVCGLDVHKDSYDLRKRMRVHPEVMGERKKVVKHEFDTLKRAFGSPYLLLRGLRKVGGEVGLLLFSYNLRRALNILGVAALIQALVKR